jgi:hypothetical protein
MRWVCRGRGLESAVSQELRSQLGGTEVPLSTEFCWSQR